MRFVLAALLLGSASLMLTSAMRADGQAKPYDPRAAFAETDTNKDGVIDIEEFHVRLVEVFYNADTSKEGFLSVDEYERLPFSGAFKDADANGDGRVSLPEFVTIRFHQFEEGDTNHDTQLSIDEVVTAYEGEKAAMKPIGVYAAGAVLAGSCLMLPGCPSAYQRTYEQETQRLEMEQRAANQQAEAAHAQASKYAAVIYFAVGSATLDEDAQRQLRWFVQQMQPYPQAMIQVQGFTDSTGSEATNTGLSLERATNVSSYLSAQGIAASRITTQGFGSNYAAASNESGQGRRNNRRVEVTVR